MPHHATDNMDMSVKDMDERINAEESDMQEYGTAGILHGNRGPFTYRVPQEIFDTLEEGDILVVKNRYGFTCGEVIEVHDVKEDVDPNIQYRWAFQKVDVETANELDPDE